MQEHANQSSDKRRVLRKALTREVHDRDDEIAVLEQECANWREYVEECEQEQQQADLVTMDDSVRIPTAQRGETLVGQEQLQPHLGLRGETLSGLLHTRAQDRLSEVSAQREETLRG